MSRIEEAFKAVVRNEKINTYEYELESNPFGYDRRDERRFLKQGRKYVTLNPTEEGIEFSNWRTWSYNLEDLQNDIRFRIVASAVAEAYLQLAKNDMEAARHLREAQERAEALAREEREALLAEREERLLTEFVGDQARVRLRNEQSLHGIFVRANPEESGFTVAVEWMKSDNDGKYFTLKNVKIFDVMVGSRYVEVWDDGYDDLLPHEADKLKRKRASVKKYREFVQ